MNGAQEAQSSLALRQLRYAWPQRAGFELSIDRFDLAQGETLLLLGESGSGKSTLLSLICGTIAPQAGQVVVNGTDLATLGRGERDRFRAENIGVIFQQFNLLPFGRVMDNILLPLRFAPQRRQRAAALHGSAQDSARALCAGLNLPRELLHAHAGSLSVGQQQRVAVARALIGQPPLIIADEPTSALDAATQGSFLDLMFSQVAAHGQSLLMVSHDARLSPHFDRVVDLRDIASLHSAPTADAQGEGALS